MEQLCDRFCAQPLTNRGKRDGGILSATLAGQTHLLANPRNLLTFVVHV
jgi:hypothetical protein